MGRAITIPNLRDNELDWHDEASCRGSDSHLSGDSESILAALVTCSSCPVRQLCEDWASRWVWAGVTVGGSRFDNFGHRSELRECSADDCNEVFVAARKTSIACSTACRNRIRWAAAAAERRELASA